MVIRNDLGWKKTSGDWEELKQLCEKEREKKGQWERPAITQLLDR